ncbi:MAG: hypothetical protein ACI4XJ_10310 [Eubacteriales bacterium]
MVVLWVILIIALLIALLLSLRVKLYIKVEDKAYIRAGVGPVVLTLTPKKHKKVKISDFTYEKHQKRLEKIKRKSEKKARKAAKKRKSDELKQKAESAASNENTTPENKLGEIIDLLKFICGEFPRLASRLHIRINRLYIVVGGGDAAETAVKYGKIQAAVSLLIELLDNKTLLSPIKEGDAAVFADFLQPKTKCEIDISLGISLYAVLKTGISALIWLIKSKIKKSRL